MRKLLPALFSIIDRNLPKDGIVAKYIGGDGVGGGFWTYGVTSIIPKVYVCQAIWSGVRVAVTLKTNANFKKSKQSDQPGNARWGAWKG